MCFLPDKAGSKTNFLTSIKHVSEYNKENPPMTHNFLIISLLVVLFSGTSLSYASSSKLLVSSPPRNIRVQQIESSLLITWKRPIRFVDGYRIYRSNAKKFLGEIIVQLDDPNVSSFVDSYVQPNTKYYYTVRSFLSIGGESRNKVQVSKTVNISKKVVTPLPIPPPTPSPAPPVIPIQNNFSEELVTYNEKRSYKIQSGNFTYYFDVNLFLSDDLKNQYISQYILLNQNSYDFVKNYFGFEPAFAEKIIVSVLNDQSNPRSYSDSNTIVNLHSLPITPQDVTNLTQGNSHELTHLFLKGSYPLAGTTAWEEGLADYVEHYAKYGSDHNKWGFTCNESGWTPINGTFVPFSDFSIAGYPSSDFFSPRNPSSYYKSGECFWIYIKEQFGENKLKKVIEEWNKVRGGVKAKKLFLEIIYPALEVDLRGLVKTRYNFEEK